MATFYLDMSGGSDAADGTSFANRWKTITSGATAARIAPGDTIRMKESPPPTSLGQSAQWTSAKLPATKSITSSTNASPIVVTCASHGYSNGDTVTIADHATNTNANGTWEVANVAANTFELTGSTGNGSGTGGTVRLRNNARVKLTSAITANIASHGNRGEGRTAWTASSNVTTSLVTTQTKEGDCCDEIVVQSGFTTGLAAYKATGTLDLSGYRQVSFWIQLVSGTQGAASAVSIKLCSDTAGATAVNTINIPAIKTGKWIPVTVDTGGALGASIASVGFYVNTDNGAQTFYISNIVACKDSTSADSLTLNSLIGKNSAGEYWWPIQSIRGTRIMLDQYDATYPWSSHLRGYVGTTESVTTYKRECFKPVIGTGDSQVESIQDSGTAGSLITFSGGWNESDMTTQSGETWIDARNYCIGVKSNVKDYLSLQKLRVVRGTYGFQIDGSDGWQVEIAAVGCENGLYHRLSYRSSGSFVTIACNYGTYSNGDLAQCNFSSIVNLANHSGEYFSFAHDINVTSWTRKNSGSALFEGSSGTSIAELNESDNSGVLYALYSDVFIQNVTLASYGIEVYAAIVTTQNTTISASPAYYNYGGGAVFATNTYTVHETYLTGTEASVRHTASGVSWYLSPTALTCDATFPARLLIAQIVVAASALVTVKAWMRRTNTGLTVRLVCPGKQISGVTNEVSASMTASADTWEELTITFTPSAAGVVAIYAEAYGGTTYTGYVDDMTITQA